MSTIRQQIGQYVQAVNENKEINWASFAALPALRIEDGVDNTNLSLIGKGNGGFTEFRESLGSDSVLGISLFGSHVLLISYQPESANSSIDLKSLAKSVQQTFGKAISLIVNSVSVSSLSDAMIVARLKHSGLIQGGLSATNLNADSSPSLLRPSQSSLNPAVNNEETNTNSLARQTSSVSQHAFSHSPSNSTISNNGSAGPRHLKSNSSAPVIDDDHELEVIPASVQAQNSKALKESREKGEQLANEVHRKALDLADSIRERTVREDGIRREIRAALSSGRGKSDGLWMSENVHGTWKQRWILITSSELRIYTDNQSRTPLLVVNLAQANDVKVIDVSEVSSMPNTFELRVLSSKTQAPLQRWFNIQSSGGRVNFLQVIAAIERAAGVDGSILRRGKSIDLISQSNIVSTVNSNNRIVA